MNNPRHPGKQRAMALLQICFLSGLLLLGAASCSDNDSTGPGIGGSNRIQNDIVFTRQDSTVLEMGSDYAICCAFWEPGYIDKNTLKIFFYDPRLWSDSDNVDSFWKLFIVVDEIAVETPYTFPTAQDTPLRLFLVDMTSGNELSGAAEESSGSITIERLECGLPVQIIFSIDAIIGSEFHLLPAVHVSGTFSATIYANPTTIGCGFSM